ncbi:iron-containing alcohol dehydrogenase (plasmid) [Streptomyces sp. NBC_00853]|uniref:3-dehydroquinate synthase family protein n=1 Tax=Streptomyces sp. NBC_00853 TaxID=2903681 RepID=UPI003872CF5C|nr:iron-containing alcohol dehydrogenase [Streptomyces sp. NBC_00853]
MYITADSSRIESTFLRFGSEGFRYFYGFDCGYSFADMLAEEMPHRSSFLLLIDSGVVPHAEKLISSFTGGPNIHSIIVDSRERHKGLPLVEKIMNEAVSAGITRNSAVLAMGGGVLGNIAGMVAALMYRGLPLVHLPTTPVSAFDSVLSAKQAVNLTHGKNLCGTFLTPSLVACDLAWLETVPRDQMLTGVAEMAKNVLCVTPRETERFLESVTQIERDPQSSLRALLEIGISAKAPFLEIDPKEKEEALVFEYGHTVGHAIEFASQGCITHGEAVGWGMLAAAEVAAQLYGLSQSAVDLHHKLVDALGLDRGRLSSLSGSSVKSFLRKDNKRGYINTSDDSVAMVLLDSLGNPVKHNNRPLVSVPSSVVDSAIDSLLGE